MYRPPFTAPAPADSRPRADILVVGQVPPPVHGQALAIERLVQAEFVGFRTVHVPMDFSSSMQDIGRVRVSKVLRLARLIWRVLRLRFTRRATVLYYPPAGPSLVPILRDLVFLNIVRPFFSHLILDLHAGGLQEMEPRLSPLLRPMFRRAYHGANLVIEKYPMDVSLPAIERVVVPYGIRDEARKCDLDAHEADGLAVLYVGLVTEEKGVWTVLEAVANVRKRGIDAKAVIVGEFASAQDRAHAMKLIAQLNLSDTVRFTGRLTGDAKWKQFRNANVFCFPSSYANEAFPIAIVEALQFGLPVIGSNWRGIPSLVEEGVSGFLVPPGDSEAVAEGLEHLALHPELRTTMGRAARQTYLTSFTESAYLQGMEAAMGKIVAGAKALRSS